MLDRIFKSPFLRRAERLGFNVNPNGRPRIKPRDLSGEKTLVLLCLGQSNAANFGETRRTCGPGVYNAFNAKIYPARDPLLGGANTGGSVWTRLGDLLLEKTDYEHVVIAPVAPGGTSIRFWEKGSGLLAAAIFQMQFLAKNNLPVNAVLWHQGEADRETPPDEYSLRLRTLISDLRAEAGQLPFFVSVTTRSRELLSPPIQAAQRQITDPAKAIFPGPETDPLTGDLRHDGVHFSDQGLTEVARLWLESLSVIL
ncbi:sialate O-acetylesterase [Desulfovibrio sp. JC010]|uniref:sialate O-acetylesterase n=1 Tax=Desulfovibrio sp. JC010 TaxID=2593641 RepID=UPI0013CFB773|nr:sialate O-acetylesterase [Desulfovibrio sp. JC010]